MRLTVADRKGLVEAARETFDGPWSLRLFGSRLDDQQRGGDIDLILLLPDADNATRAMQAKARFLVKAKAKVGDRRIDLVIGSAEQARTDPFLRQILPTAVELGSGGG
ncbi:MAG: nucleotidyltransferase domain-containing protein [Candidatus Sericytochromatia bacterium]|nr:nucleotidyltransferase domain-containing protein [Candidatus Sericytochromatia bacterium]